MSLSRRKFLKNSAAAIGLAACNGDLSGAEAAAAHTEGPFQPSWESLAKYQCPDWFRDAKFGIWAHWSAQCVPEQGDWYARSMYEEGSHDYQYQCEHYGHPSKVGFKEIDHLWHAEHWDPEKLMGLYKAAGAQYFVALANHHDNFDCYDSKYQPWNSVNIGPHKDLVGTWARVARKHGLRFGVTVHASHAWNWFEVAQGSDKKGPLAGVPYDGKLTKEDGKGQWWEGYDPQDLYAQNHAPGKMSWTFDVNEGSSIPDRAYCEKFFNRTVDLIDKYHPDLLYFDDSGLPLEKISDAGLRIAAHFYNSSRRWHGGRVEAILNTKGLNEEKRRCMVEDYERGRSDKIQEHPWQTDTCIGNWHYQRSLYENHQYKGVQQVVRMLVDIVSKNGNLLLNIPVRGNGEIDEDEVKFLQGMAAWMKVNSEAIFKTRPWKIAGEGPVKVKGGGFSEGGEDRLTAHDFRFTTKGDILYVTAMGWPENGKYTIRTLAANAAGIQGKITGIQLLGSKARLSWTQDEEGLQVTLPQQKPCDHAWVLKISGLDLAASQPVPPTYAAAVVQPDNDGAFHLTAEGADLQGSLHLESRGGLTNIGFWDNPGDSASWTMSVPEPGLYTVTARCASMAASELALDAGDQKLAAPIPATGGFDAFQTLPLGRIQLPQGHTVLKAHPQSATSWKPINLASLTLTRVRPDV